MNLIDIIKEALSSLRLNFKRTLLTVLGIVIGIFAVTIMLALGDGVKKSIAGDIGSYSDGDISINAYNENQILNPDDLDWIRSQAYVKNALAIDQSSKEVYAFGKKLHPNLIAVNGPYSDIKKIQVLEGQVFDWVDNNLDRKIVLADERFAKSFKKEMKKDAFGETLLINDQTFEIVGVIKIGSGAGARWGDGNIYLPSSSMSQYITGRKGTNRIALNLKNSDFYAPAMDHLKKSLNLSRGLSILSDDFVEVESSREWLEQSKKITGKFNLLLGVIGGISLLIGGIGTMNMMLTTISERTKEIGLRKAIGAKDTDITFQILIESILLTLVGGILGVIFTIFIVLVANNFIPESLGFKLSVSPSVVGIALFVSAVVGVVFGVGPAKKAAKLQPVDALRSD